MQGMDEMTDAFTLSKCGHRDSKANAKRPIALGATRRELLWDLFADSLVISVAGGAVGLLLGILTAHALPAFLFEEDAARVRFAAHLLPIDDRRVRTEIIGMVKSQAFGTFEQHAEPAIYFPIWQDCPARMTLMINHEKWNKEIEGDLRGKVESVAGRAPDPIGIQTLDEQLAQSGLAALRIATLIGGVSAAMGLMLSLLGLLGAQSDAERHRQRDRALRIALGSQRWQIVLTVMNNAGRLAVVGTLAGTLLSLAFMRGLMAGIAAVSLPPLEVWLMAPIVPAAAVLIASMIPARRASVISPMTVLRDS